MRRFLLLVLLSAGPALAQVPDTLDPHGYFPLAVGNEWEYRVGLYRPATIYRPEDESRTEYLRLRVVADESGADANWFSLVEAKYSDDATLLSQDTVAVRFDSTTATVVALREQQDGEDYESPYSFFASHLDAPIGGSATREPLFVPDFLETVDSDRVKSFFTMVWTYTSVHGVGFVGGSGGCEPCSSFSDEDSWTLTYAYVGGDSFGVRLAGEESIMPAQPPNLNVFPNPTRGRVTIRFAAAEVGEWVSVYDVTGRLVRSAGLPLEGTTSLDLGGLSSGLYVIRLGDQMGRVVVQ